MSTGPFVRHTRGGDPFADCDAGCLHMDDGVRHTETCATVEAWRRALQGPDKRIRIVFSPAADSPDITFVDVENDWHQSVAVGNWVEQGDGMKVLIIRVSDIVKMGRRE